MSGRTGRAARAAAALLVLAWAAGAAQAAPSAQAAAALGQRLFDGREPLQGTIGGHAKPLPPQAARCANCHKASPEEFAGTGSVAEMAKAQRKAIPAPITGPSEPTPVAPEGAANPYAARNGSPFGPSLNARLLTRPAERRGGPSSVYDEQAFCRVLRKGIDPAYVGLTRAMPRYEQLSDAHCHALWTYLSRI